MNHESVSITEIDLEKYLKENADIINVLISAFYSYETRKGRYKNLLLYKGHKLVVEGVLENVNSPNHAMVLGLIETVEHINLRGINVCFISGIYVGFKGAKRGKGLYAKEIKDLVSIVEGQGNTISSIAITDGMDEIKRIIRMYEK